MEYGIKSLVLKKKFKFSFFLINISSLCHSVALSRRGT